MKKIHLIAMAILLILATGSRSFAIGTITGPATMCQYEGPTYSETTSGGSWSTSSAIATVVPTSATTATVIGLTAGTVTLTYTVGSTYTTKTITIYPKPYLEIHGRDSVCYGKPDTLYAVDTITAGTIYIWSGTGISCAVCDTNIIATTTTSTYTVMCTNMWGCTDTATPSISPFPSTLHVTPATATVCRDSTIQLHATGCSYYSWSPATGLSCTSCANPVDTASTNITYTIWGGNTHGCTDTDHVSITVDTACINAIPDLSIIPAVKLFPNPASQYLNVITSQALLVSITNVTGSVRIEGNSPATIDISNLSGGLHFITLYDEERRKVFTDKVVIQR